MKLIQKLSIALLSAGALLVSACQSGPASGPDPIITSQPVSSRANAAAYTLSSGDQVRVTVFGHTDLSGQFDIDGSGAFSMPLIGQIQAEGLTTPQLEQRIKDRLSAGYLVDPRVSAEVTTYRPFYILGEVRNPGEYPYTNGITVMEAVASAGGFTYRAKKSVVFVRGTDSASEVEKPLTATTQVEPGDTLRIGERIF